MIVGRSENPCFPGAVIAGEPVIFDWDRTISACLDKKHITDT